MRSQLEASEPDPLDDLEELGDDAIIAQQTEAHALRPRANVSEESRSVVITELPRRRDTQPPSGLSQSGGVRRPSGEATLVIRDRRALDELRKDIIKRQERKRKGSRPLYLWAALGLIAFVLGGVVAFLATDSHSAAPSADNQTQGARIEAQPLVPATAAPAAAAVTPTPAETTHAVRLDDLPVEPKHKR
ncbi:MAG: hypothetical protein ABI488_10590 [Polyangiaceae bacterium]